MKEIQKTVIHNVEHNSPAAATRESSKEENPMPTWVKFGASFAGGAAAGLGGALLLGGIPAAAAEVSDEASDEVVEPVEDSSNTWSDGSIKVAGGVNDGMSFGEAFAAARAEVGPGGVFEWRGGVYGTYNASEWGSMSPAERGEWSSHFNWSNVTREPEQNTEHPHHDNPVEDPVVDVEDEPRAEHPREDRPRENRPTEDNPEDVRPEEDVPEDDPNTYVEPVIDINEPSSYSIHTVFQGDNGLMYAVGECEGHECVLCDTDNDGVFDVVAVDVNDNNELDDAEMMQLSPDAGLSVQWAMGEDVTDPVEPDPDGPWIDDPYVVDPYAEDPEIDDPADDFDPDYIEPTNFDDI